VPRLGGALAGKKVFGAAVGGHTAVWAEVRRALNSQQLARARGGGARPVHCKPVVAGPTRRAACLRAGGCIVVLVCSK